MQYENTVLMASKEQQDQEPDFGRAEERKFKNSVSEQQHGRYNFAFPMSFLTKLTFSHYNS